jgi:tetratricopeptide (TPR) repeat protein
MGDVDGAIICYRQAIKASPRSADDYVNLGLAYFQKGQSKEAVDAWEQALALKPDQASVQNNLAWLLATVPEAGLRNGAKAVGLAEQARQLSGGANPVVLQTLAAAYAETGRYGEAAATARRALELAEAQKDGDLAGRLQDQIKLYMAGKPLREAPRPAGNLKAKT